MPSLLAKLTLIHLPADVALEAAVTVTNCRLNAGFGNALPNRNAASQECGSLPQADLLAFTVQSGFSAKVDCLGRLPSGWLAERKVTGGREIAGRSVRRRTATGITYGAV